MSAANALICAIIFYGFLWLIGRATISLCRYQSGTLEAQAISPVIGLAILTLLTTCLVLLGIPLGAVSKNMGLGIAIFSVCYLVSDSRHRAKDKGNISIFDFFLPLVITAGLIVLPFAIGQYEFAILRGNGTDAFNYVTMADALTKYPLDWILTQTKETLTTYSPNLPLAQDLLKSRWSTSALLAFTSSALGIAPVEFEYGFTLTFMVILFNALVAAMHSTVSLNKLTVWLAVALVAGFWGQFTLDIRAFSQIVSLPLLVMLIGWLLTDAHSKPIFRYGVPLTAVLLAALFFQYPEIIVAFFPGAGLIFLIRLWILYRENSLTKQDGNVLFGAVIATIVLCAPLFKFVVGFAIEQGRFAVNKSPGWETAYFPWMKNSILGLWGAEVNPGIGFDHAFTVFAFILTLALTVGITIRSLILVSTRQRLQNNLSEAGLFLLAGSGLAGAALLDLKGNIWAAGKVISYFAVLIPLWMAIYLANRKSLVAISTLYKAFTYMLWISIIAWGGWNLVFAGARILHAVNGSDFLGYIEQHGEYRKVDANDVAKMPFIHCASGSIITIFEPTIWGREFLTHYAEGKGFSAATPGFSQSRINEPNQVSMPDEISCVLANRKYYDASSLPPAAHNWAEFVATPPGDHFATLLSLEGGYGVEFDQATATRYVWTGQQDVRLTLLARAPAYTVGLKVCSGIARGVNEALTIFVEVDGNRVSQHEVRDCIDLDVKLVGKKETLLQNIRITSADPRPGPTLIGPDLRDLRLRVDVNKVRLK